MKIETANWSIAHEFYGSRETALNAYLVIARDRIAYLRLGRTFVRVQQPYFLFTTMKRCNSAELTFFVDRWDQAVCLKPSFLDLAINVEGRA